MNAVHEAINEEGLVIWPKRFKPLPRGYRVYQLDSGHFLWVNGDDEEGVISWDRYWVRRCAFAHAKEQSEKDTGNG